MARQLIQLVRRASQQQNAHYTVESNTECVPTTASCKVSAATSTNGFNSSTFVVHICLHLSATTCYVTSEETDSLAMLDSNTVRWAFVFQDKQEKGASRTHLDFGVNFSPCAQHGYTGTNCPLNEDYDLYQLLKLLVQHTERKTHTNTPIRWTI